MNEDKMGEAKMDESKANEDRAVYYANRLGRMIRCKTVSVKDGYDDTEFAKLRLVMEELFPLIHQKAERHIFSDDCWIYRIAGKDMGRNVMLMSHHDVVDAEAEKWDYEPFSAEIVDGKLWGRGSVDTKTPLFAEFSALEELLGEGWEAPCNIWIGSSHNEEQGGDGIPAAFVWFKENGVTFDAVLDEGGAIIDPPLGNMKVDKCAMVAVHEKGRYKLSFTATSGNAHAGLTAATSVTPVERMAGLVHKINGGDMFIRRLNPQVKAMFTHLAPYCKFPMNFVLGHLGLFGGIIQKIMPKLNPQAGSMIGTTCAVNKIEGDGKRCTATASFRSVDADDMEKDLQTLRNVAESFGVEMTVEEGSEYHGPADMSRPAFAYTMDCIRNVFPDYPPVPFILPAGTDARTLTDICPCVLRFAPIVLSAGQLASVHADNENIDLGAIVGAVAFYKYFLGHLEGV